MNFWMNFAKIIAVKATVGPIASAREGGKPRKRDAARIAFFFSQMSGHGVWAGKVVVAAGKCPDFSTLIGQ
jgi:hypothetical protein